METSPRWLGFALETDPTAKHRLATRTSGRAPGSVEPRPSKYFWARPRAHILPAPLSLRPRAKTPGSLFSGFISLCLLLEQRPC